ncbi:hypothetical protein AMTR_s00442p00011250, partial [Amborella trichopoda]
ELGESGVAVPMPSLGAQGGERNMCLCNKYRSDRGQPWGRPRLNESVRQLRFRTLNGVV